LDKLKLIVAKEYTQRVRTKSFVISTILGPVAMLVLFLGPALLAEKTGAEERDVAVVEMGDGNLYDALTAILATTDPDSRIHFERYELDGRTREEAREDLTARVKAKELNAFLILDADFLESGTAVYYGEQLSDVASMRGVKQVLDGLLAQHRMRDMGVSPEDLQSILAGADLATRHIEDEDTGTLGARLMAGIFMVMMLYFMILFYGVHSMNAVIEDKSNRVVEVMLASVTSTELMTGKIVGNALVAISQFSVWAGFGLAFAKLAPQFLPGDFDVSVLATTLWLWFSIYFLLGYLLFASLYAGVGAMCASVQDAQQFQAPLTMLIVLPMLLLQMVIQAPDSTLSTVLSMIPFLTPILMFIRIVAGKPELWQIALSILILGGTAVFMAKAAGKLFRLGILNFGKTPGWKEMLAMLRSPE